MLHSHAKSLSSSWDYSGLYFKNNITMNIVEIVVLLTDFIISNMTSWIQKRYQGQRQILLLDQLITHYLFYVVKLKSVFGGWICSIVNIKHFLLCFYKLYNCKTCCVINLWQNITSSTAQFYGMWGVNGLIKLFLWLLIYIITPVQQRLTRGLCNES